ncbi:MAG TPA: hypothetical protein VHV77_09340, partial [Pirellulales bacterium]|nr:hypothetical protein [Pirellulales bacterium]
TNPRDMRILQVTLSPTIFFMQSSMAQMEYAEALEDDHAQALASALEQRSGPAAGRVANADERMQNIDRDYKARILAAWAEAARMWERYGQHPYVSYEGQPYRLVDLPTYEKELKTATDKLEALAPGVRQRLKDEKYAGLDPAERRVYEMNGFERSKEQNELADRIALKLLVGHEELARHAEKDKAHAAKLAQEVIRLEALCNQVRTERQYAEFDYWRARCRIEQTPEAREARRLIHRATVAFNEADPQRCRDDFALAFNTWADVLRNNAELQDDPTTRMMDEAIHRYEGTLKQLDESFPKDFVLDRLRENG